MTNKLTPFTWPHSVKGKVDVTQRKDNRPKVSAHQDPNNPLCEMARNQKLSDFAGRLLEGNFDLKEGEKEIIKSFDTAPAFAMALAGELGLHSGWDNEHIDNLTAHLSRLGVRLTRKVS